MVVNENVKSLIGLEDAYWLISGSTSKRVEVCQGEVDFEINHSFMTVAINEDGEITDKRLCNPYLYHEDSPMAKAYNMLSPESLVESMDEFVKFLCHKAITVTN